MNVMTLETSHRTFYPVINNALVNWEQQ